MQNNLKKSALATSVSLALALLTNPALAQEAQVPTSTEATPNPITEADKDDASKVKTLDKVLVTGSLIRQNDLKTDAPVEVIEVDSAIAKGISTVGELMRQVSAVSGSSQTTAAGGTMWVRDGGEGTENVALRGLGPNRTLVLLNGKRAGPAGTRGATSAFDFNVLPLSVVERIEILKDGASSLYGSDAIAGVINIITKKGSSSQFDLYAFSPEAGGAEELRGSASWGVETEKGSFRIVADYKHQKELAQGDRDYLKCAERGIFDPSTGNQIDPIDPRTGKAHCNNWWWGHNWIYDYSDPPETSGLPPGVQLSQYDYDGSLAAAGLPPFPYVPDPNNPNLFVTPAGWFPVGYDRLSDGLINATHPFEQAQSLQPATTIGSVYMRGEYNFSDHLQGYSELLLNRRKTSTNGANQFWGYRYKESSDPRSAGWSGNEDGGGYLDPLVLTDNGDSITTVKYSRLLAGLNGDFKNWFWDASYQYSRSEGVYEVDDIYKDAVIANDWTTDSCVGTYLDRGPACVDIPWMDPQFLIGNAFSPELRNFLFYRSKGKTLYEQHSFDLTVSGDLFELPAGTVGSAFGVQIRKDRIDDVPDENWQIHNSWLGNAAGITRGKDTAKDAFGEVKFPLIADVPGMKRLDLAVSGRFSKVDSSGSGKTYKLAANWEIVDGFSIRAGKGTSFRSPSLFELYLSNEIYSTPQRGLDPCIEWQSNLDLGQITQRIADNCAAEGIAPDFGAQQLWAEVSKGGGLGVLKAETSIAKSIGAVWTTELADGRLSMSLDYFDFLITGEVNQIGPGNITWQCYNSEFFPSDPMCDLFDRTTPADNIDDGRIAHVKDSFINVAAETNKAYDFAANYDRHFKIGDLSAQLRYTRQIESSRAVFEGYTQNWNGHFGDPIHTGTLDLGLTRENWWYHWNMQYQGAVSNISDRGLDGNLADYRGETVKLIVAASPIWYHNVSASHKFTDKGFTATLGVNNLLNTRPPRVSTYQGVTNTVGTSAIQSQYDFFGRSYYLSVTYDF